ncbi:E3 ubiquitin-protein ligase TRIM47-like [Tachysurus fulvidraco]|uniref:E3 ubiquitin-protein ligase TRIM47-like n=1 Tax=Tachysurus fulvidraco TaxID=1234273 RepID=UPI001FEDE759|nr:E3 ubiquitin-protein ligase TRIM47-like [Tachysurus fulvidraco]
MAEVNVLINEDEFCCSVCLELLKDPVTLACGHSFCMSCITSSWDQQVGIYTCPQCRATFDTRPSLCRNNMLAGLVEKLKQRGLELSDHCYAKSGDVECDICTGIKYKAVKSCLVCLASYCADHFRPHKESSALMKHTVTEASAKLHEKICQQHGKPMELYCCTDQKCICYLCTLDEHSNHNIVSAVAERAEKEKQVLETQNNYTQRILEREEDRLKLVESLESIKNSAQVVVEDISRLFQELIQSILIKCSEVTNQISAQEDVEVTHTKEHLKQVEQEIVELKSQNDELKQLLQTQDDTLFLQSFQSFHDFRLPEAISRVNINIPHSYEDVKIFVHKLKENIESSKLSMIPDSASQMNSHQMTSQNSQELSQIPTIDIRFKTFAGSETTGLSSTTGTQFQSTFGFSSRPDTKPQYTFGLQKTTGFGLFSTPVTQPKSLFGFTKPSEFGLSSPPTTQSQTLFGLSSKPATQSQTVFGLSSKPDTQSQSAFGLSSQPATQSQTLFGLSSKPATQSQSAFGLYLQPATRSQSAFGLSSPPATQSQSAFGLSSPPATKSQSAFGLSSPPATQSQTLFGLSSKPATQSQSAFGLSSPPATQSQTLFGLSSKPATQSQSAFGLYSPPATQSQTLFGLPSKPATQSQSAFGLYSPPATQSQTLFGLPSKPATQSQSAFGLSSEPATQSQTPFGLSSPPATQSQSAFGLSSPPATQSQSAFGLSSPPATQSQSAFGMY